MVYTYIMKSHNLHKIGKANNVETRLKQFQTGNPYIEVVRSIEGSYEMNLHELYKDKRVTGEWFKLSEEDLIEIDRYIEQKKSVHSLMKNYSPEPMKNHSTVLN